VCPPTVVLIVKGLYPSCACHVHSLEWRTVHYFSQKKFNNFLPWRVSSEVVYTNPSYTAAYNGNRMAHYSGTGWFICIYKSLNIWNMALSFRSRASMSFFKLQLSYVQMRPNHHVTEISENNFPRAIRCIFFQACYSVYTSV